VSDVPVSTHSRIFPEVALPLRSEPEPGADSAVMSDPRHTPEFVTLQLTPKAARNLEILLNRAAVGPYFSALQVVTGVAVYRGLEAAIAGHQAAAFILLLWGFLAVFAGGASSSQQLAIVSALRSSRQDKPPQE
jgi:hypothetical protein